MPSVRWEPIPPSDCRDLDLSPMERWEGLYVGWLGFGMLVVARPVRGLRA